VRRRVGQAFLAVRLRSDFNRGAAGTCACAPTSRASSWNVCGLNPRLSANKEAPAQYPYALVPAPRWAVL